MAAGIKNIIPGIRKPDASAEPGAGPLQQTKLLELFENRNQIKRELDVVTAERDALREELETLRSQHLESQRQLNNLEQMLADAERGQSAIVYYRLRAVWDTCRQQLRLLADDLNSRFEKAERGGFEQDLGRERSHRLDELAQQFDKLERERRTLRNQLAELQQQMAGLQKFWHKRKRDMLQFQIDKLTRQFKPIETRKLELLASMEALRNQKPQTWPGISIASKRTVNLWLLALAQYLYLHLTEYNIAEMARSAGTKAIADVHFGLLNDCLAIGNHIYEVVVKLRTDKARPEKLRFRTEHLRTIASYASEQETVPDESCLEYIPRTSHAAPTIDAEAEAVAMNVLRMNYWDIQNLLLMPAAAANPAGPAASLSREQSPAGSA